MSATIALAWRTGRLPQQETCAALRIHQSQFSRLVNGRFVRPTGHAAALFAYAERQLKRHDRADPWPDHRLKEQLLSELLAAWDGTRAGADALRQILRGARHLRTAQDE